MDFKGMLRTIRSESKHVLVVGLGISGIEASRFLNRIGINVIAVEREQEARYRTQSKFKEHLADLENLGVKLCFGIDGESVRDLISNVALAVLSPGVPLDSAICGSLSRHGVPMVSELELGIELSGGRTVVVTGSNGKSTTVTLIEALLNSGGMKARLCGNVGTPVVAGLGSDVLEQNSKSDEILIVEASSYQLESCTVLKPTIGIFLNLSENHLERHGTLERYRAAKARLFQHQTESDLAILNVDDSQVAQLLNKLRSKVATCGRGKPPTQPVWGSAIIAYSPSDGRDEVKIVISGNEEIYSCKSLHLLGLHNRYNVGVAILAARSLGIGELSVRSTLEAFEPLEHRIEFIVNDSSLTVINDSKSTTVAASCAAVEAVCEHFPGRSVRVLLGGLSKAGSWGPLIRVLERERARLSPVVCFGKDGNIISDHLESAGIPFVRSGTLRETVPVVLSEAAKGEILLFTPGCASFDEFKDFEDRGEAFKGMVLTKLGAH